MGSRPGGGYYCDHSPRGVLWKALDLARQVRALPAEIQMVCPEIENFPHAAMGKTAHGTSVESAWYLAQSDCNSLSYALVCSGHEDASFYGSQLSVLEKWAPFFERYLRENEGTTPGGFDPVMGREHLKRPARDKGTPMGWAEPSVLSSYGFATLGLAMCPDGVSPCGAVLGAEAARGLTEAEARHLLSGAVILDGQALHAIRLIRENLPRVMTNPKDEKARNQLQIAATMAGWAFTIAQVGLAHAMAHTLGILYNVPHGAACGIVLPAVMRFNVDFAADKLALAAQAMGVNIAEMDARTAALSAADAVEKLMKAAGHPMRLRDVNVPEEGLDMAAFHAICDTAALFNARPVGDPGEIAALYKAVY